MSSVISAGAGDALIISQDAAAQQDIDACPANGPTEGYYLELAAEATVLSVLCELPCFQELEALRQRRDKRETTLQCKTFSRRFNAGHGWGAPPQQQAADSGDGGTHSSKKVPVHWTAAAQARLLACSQGLEASGAAGKQYFRTESGWLYRVPRKGVALGIGLVKCDDTSLKTHFPDYERFRQACGVPLTDSNREQGIEEWKACVQKLRRAQHKWVVMDAKIKQCPTQLRTMHASEDLRAETAASASGGELVERPAPLDLADAMQAGLTGLHDYVRALYFSPHDFECVKFLCARIKAALDGGAGLEYYNLMESARQSVNSLVKMHGPPKISTFPLPAVREEKLEWWQCALTGKSLEDPVLTPDGRSFERQAINDWLAAEQERSKRTDCPEMVDNVPLRDALTWLNQQDRSASPAAEITDSEAASASENRATSASDSPKASPDTPDKVIEPEIVREKEDHEPKMDEETQSPSPARTSGSPATVPRSPGKRSGDNLLDCPGSSPSKRQHVGRTL